MKNTRKMKEVLVLSAALLFATPLVAQNNMEDDSAGKSTHAVGAGAGFTTGYGLSYRYTPGKFGVQVNFAPYHDKETSRYSIGVSPLYTLIQNKSSSLYLYQGNHYYYNSEVREEYNPNVPGASKKNRYKENYFNNGVGIGVEFVILKRIGFNLMAGYAAYKNFEELNVTGETAMYYKF